MLVLQDVGQLDTDSSHPIACPIENHAVGVGILGQATRALDEIRDLFSLCLERISTGVFHLAGNDSGSLELPVWLTQNKHVIVRLNGDFRVWPGRSRQSRRAQILAVRSALEDVARVERNA